MLKVNTPYQVGDKGLVIMFDEFCEKYDDRSSVILHAWTESGAYLFQLWRKWDKTSQLSNIGGVQNPGVIADDIDRIADYVLVAGRCAELYLIWANQERGFSSPLFEEMLLEDQLIPDRKIVFIEETDVTSYLWSPEISGS